MMCVLHFKLSGQDVSVYCGVGSVLCLDVCSKESNTIQFKLFPPGQSALPSRYAGHVNITLKGVDEFQVTETYPIVSVNPAAPDCVENIEHVSNSLFTLLQSKSAFEVSHSLSVEAQLMIFLLRNMSRSECRTFTVNELCDFGTLVRSVTSGFDQNLAVGAVFGFIEFIRGTEINFQHAERATQHVSHLVESSLAFFTDGQPVFEEKCSSETEQPPLELVSTVPLYTNARSSVTNEHLLIQGACSIVISDIGNSHHIKASGPLVFVDPESVNGKRFLESTSNPDAFVPLTDEKFSNSLLTYDTNDPAAVRLLVSERHEYLIDEMKKLLSDLVPRRMISYAHVLKEETTVTVCDPDTFKNPKQLETPPRKVSQTNWADLESDDESVKEASTKSEPKAEPKLIYPINFDELSVSQITAQKKMFSKHFLDWIEEHPNPHYKVERGTTDKDGKQPATKSFSFVANSGKQAGKRIHVSLLVVEDSLVIITSYEKCTTPSLRDNKPFSVGNTSDEHLLNCKSVRFKYAEACQLDKQAMKQVLQNVLSMLSYTIRACFIQVEGEWIIDDSLIAFVTDYLNVLKEGVDYTCEPPSTPTTPSPSVADDAQGWVSTGKKQKATTKTPQSTPKGKPMKKESTPKSKATSATKVKSTPKK